MWEFGEKDLARTSTSIAPANVSSPVVTWVFVWDKAQLCTKVNQHCLRWGNNDYRGELHTRPTATPRASAAPCNWRTQSMMAARLACTCCRETKNLLKPCKKKKNGVGHPSMPPSMNRIHLHDPLPMERETGDQTSLLFSYFSTFSNKSHSLCSPD